MKDAVCATAAPNNRMQQPALRAAADAERSDVVLSDARGKLMRLRATQIALLLFLTLTQVACVGFSLAKTGETHPPESGFDVDARLEPIRRGYYLAHVSIKNRSGASLSMDRSMFAMSAPSPVSFVRANRVAFGRQAFRVPPSVSAGGFVEGEIYFGIRGVTLWWFPVSLFWTPRPTMPVTFKVALPDGEHSFDFVVD